MATPQEDPLLSNRLTLDNTDNDGSKSSSADCDIVGLFPYTSSLPVGLSHEASLAMKLAIRHLNSGNGSVIKEVQDLNQNCPIRFAASFEDTKRNGAHAFSIVDEYTKNSISTSSSSNPQQSTQQQTIPKKPCAFVGEIDSQISKTTSLVTGLRGVPQISPGSTSTALSDKKDYPLFGRTCSDDAFTSELFVRFLHDTLGVRHLFVIFESHAFTRSIHKSLREAIHKLGWEPGRTVDSETNANDNNSSSEAMYMEDRMIESRTSEFEVSKDMVLEAVEALKDSQYRFVLVLTSDIDVMVQLARVAYEAGLVGNNNQQNNGSSGYHWWAFENLNELAGLKFPKDSLEAQIFSGWGSIEQQAGEKGDAYRRFVQESKEFKRQLYKEYDDFPKNQENWLFAPGVPLLNESEWLEGDDFRFNPAKYAYDATILLGLSACKAVTENSDSNSLHLTGPEYFESIKKTSFYGVTGNVVLDTDTGTRVGTSERYVIQNWQPIDALSLSSSSSSNEVVFVPTVAYEFEASNEEATAPTTAYIFEESRGTALSLGSTAETSVTTTAEWQNVGPFIYSGGVMDLPENPGLPPVEITLNTVRLCVLVLAWGLAAIIILTSAGFAMWTCYNRKSRVVRASQPFFLLLLCFGIAVMASSIIPITFEHWYYFQSSATCNWIVWLFTIGFGITFSTLFAKTYRVNQIIASTKKFRRVKISLAETLYPVAAVLLFNIVMLSLMTSLAPITHQKFLTNEDDFGRPMQEFRFCCYTDSRPYIFTIFGVNFAMVFLALFQGWRARHLSTEYAETRYINSALLVILIVILCAVPVMYLTQKNPDVDTFINSILVSVVSSTVLCFMFVPKINMYHNKPRLSSNSFNLRAQSSTASSRISSGSVPQHRISSSAELRDGEKILTTKPQEELAREMRRLQRTIDTLRAREMSRELLLDAYKKLHPEDKIDSCLLGLAVCKEMTPSEDYPSCFTSDEENDDESVVEDLAIKTTHRKSSSTFGTRVSSIFASASEMRLRSNNHRTSGLEVCPQNIRASSLEEEEVALPKSEGV